VAEAVQEALREVAATLMTRGRDDLAARIRAAAVRASRPATVVCVVGEFKQGKSLLVNALLGRPICPVDDDLATSAITIIQRGDEPTVVVYRRSGNQIEKHTVDPARLSDWVTEAGSGPGREQVERVVVGFEHPLLDQGLTLVDTPGVGGFAAGHARATTAFLPYADALIFVTDASAELSAPEIEFLRLAVERCPQVVVALTKTDLYPQWQKIADLDRQHLGNVLNDVPLIPVSAVAAVSALRQRDEALAGESGIPELRERILQGLLDQSRDRAVRRSLDEARELIDHMIALASQELEVVQDPTRIAEANAVYEEAVAKLEQVRGPGSRWGQLLNDRMSDISNQASFRLRGGMRELAGGVDTTIEELSNSAEWDELSARLQDEVAGLLSEVFGSIEEGAAAIRHDLARLVADETAAELPEEARGLAAAILAGIDARPATLEDESGAKRAVGTVVPALRGAQSGLMLFGLLGRLLPVGAAGLMMSNPISLVIGAAFAGKQIYSVRQRTLSLRRQRARSAVKGFLDDVQFEASHQLAETVRRLQRIMRDESATRVVELQRSYQQMAEQAKLNVASTYEQQVERAQQLRKDLEKLRSLRGKLGTAGGAT
jgi:signal recognition particle receptor subunit beta